jgi:putative DNA primase/helicase
MPDYLACHKGKGAPWWAHRSRFGDWHPVSGWDTGNVLLDAALSYAAKGWPVVPLHTPTVRKQCDCGKPDEGEGRCTSPGKHPRLTKGLNQASTEEDVIRKWWSMWPNANVGIRTGLGEPPHWGPLAVLDIDDHHGGGESLSALMVDMDLDVFTPCALTGGGGMHLLYLAGDLEIHNSASVLGKGLDVRGVGGYIVAAPSLHASGKRYRWSPGASPFIRPMKPFPESLWALLAARRPSLPTPRDWTSGERFIKEGQRNVMLASLGGTMRRRGMEEPEILAALLTVNERRCSPALTAPDVEKIAWSVARYSPDNVECPVQPGGMAISAAEVPA